MVRGKGVFEMRMVLEWLLEVLSVLELHFNEFHWVWGSVDCLGSCFRSVHVFELRLTDFRMAFEAFLGVRNAFEWIL